MLSAISPKNYCSSSCAATINNHLYPRRARLFQKCVRPGCDKIFKKPTIFCSVSCKNISARAYTAEELITILGKTSGKLGRTPAKRELQEIVSAVVNTFGTWNAGIKAAGLEPNRSDSQRMYKRTRTIAKDGHQCDSISEAIIDNWLIEKGIEHERDVRYPDTNHKADWMLSGKIFVEYFGLANDSPRYDREIKSKRQLCKKYNIKLIELYPNDLYPAVRLSEKLLGA